MFRRKAIVPSLLLLSLLSLSLVGCKKISYDLTKTNAPQDNPNYTVEFDPNRSPAEGGVRKAQ